MTKVLRILVVEDEPLIQMAICMALEDAGYRVSTAETAMAAVEVEDLDRPHFVLLDLNLGDGIGDTKSDGVKAGRAIRSLRPQLPIAFLTAHADPENMQRMKSIGPCAILSKPFDDTALVTTITGIIAAKAV